MCGCYDNAVAQLKTFGLVSTIMLRGRADQQTFTRRRIRDIKMNNSAFVEIEFSLLVVFAIILPIGFYSYMMRKKAISRKTVLLLGIALVAMAGVSVFLLQRLNVISKSSASLLDDRIFASEISIALYLLPLLFAGIGVNLISDILIRHLNDAERQFDQDRR
jgi:hypothetical protein